MRGKSRTMKDTPGSLFPRLWAWSCSDLHA